jgi:salicylate hydroxylase
VTEHEEEVTLKFEDGGHIKSGMLLGCDGLHSATRRLWVEPERKTRFTGRVLAMGWAEGRRR